MAVGLQSGMTVVFDITNPTDEPVISSADQPHHWQHVQPAWVVRFALLEGSDIREGEMEEESLVSASTDGRILKGVMVTNKVR